MAIHPAWTQVHTFLVCGLAVRAGNFKVGGDMSTLRVELAALEHILQQVYYTMEGVAICTDLYNALKLIQIWTRVALMVTVH